MGYRFGSAAFFCWGWLCQDRRDRRCVSSRQGHGFLRIQVYRYIGTCVHVCVYIYAYTYIYIYTHIVHMCVYLHLYIPLYVYICICTYERASPRDGCNRRGPDGSDGRRLPAPYGPGSVGEGPRLKRPHCHCQAVCTCT